MKGKGGTTIAGLSKAARAQAPKPSSGSAAPKPSTPNPAGATGGRMKVPASRYK